ncbi:MAG: sarcosine oxidase subunit delta [Rhodobacteraceae bacterium]|jgi:sarcosine oxidase subunit delta|uniref:Sarcosine oxidase subunit delta n=2 Tax=Cobetia TaxID=204286 RepID=A0AAP4X081_9GAMM|nr:MULTISPECIES: sarcosine oxidase subunit delta [Cobetia]AVV32884.1 sarcosine oxidase subunit delta [Halomonas sp. SF2003]MBR9766097.1 sarcosine oxidase subunit delta [Paracoccaceae bacterium]AOM01605.1 sarcosine oxidase subunit delta [Cobetia marina]AZV31506.1 sarcosine oxidase subunit delta [Cobetia sp. ICG0124]KPM80540.1 sarcosine oxidase subunit delta [Cobetia sp. UCD-24C]|tara:strand:+ start:513 stop:824 length:312 start_codon:yes stop_codon:yes gene_type:complete
MKIMPCPLNGPRNISEFVYGGELADMPDPDTCSDREWADYVFFSDNTAGVVTEWWMHAASSYWFLAERHTVTDEILRTFDPSERFTQRVEFPLHTTDSSGERA